MVSGYKTEPVNEYEHILSNIRQVLSEAEEQFNTAELRMNVTARSNTEGDVEKLVSEQINWGLDYLRRQGLVESKKNWEIGKSASYSHEWLKNGYTDGKLEEVINELEY